jgi:hypothetical protein
MLLFVGFELMQVVPAVAVLDVNPATTREGAALEVAYAFKKAGSTICFRPGDRIELVLEGKADELCWKTWACLTLGQKNSSTGCIHDLCHS